MRGEDGMAEGVVLEGENADVGVGAGGREMAARFRG